MYCSHSDRCGGCSLLHQSYPEQLAGKEQTLSRLLGEPARSAIKGRGALFLPLTAVDPDGPRHFRQKVAFVFCTDPGGRGLVMGHYQRGSQRVVAVDECPVHSARGNRIAFALRDRLVRAGISAAGPSLSGILRHLIVRTSADDRDAIAMLVVTRNDKALRNPIRALLESDERPDGFFLNIHDEPGPFMVGPETVRIAGHAHVRERLGGITFQVSPTAFFQTSVQAASLLQQYVVSSVAGAARVLDLYCGSGLFSLPLAATGVAVTGVEENRQAVRDAEGNASLNRIARGSLRFVAARVEDALRRLGRHSWDAVILDPPRHGCSPAVLDELFVSMRPPRVTYVSCNPEALALELPGILKCGYRIADIRAVDMFPHTDHIETIVKLERTS